MTENTQPAAPTDRPLEGRIALITGASRGLGAAVAERYAMAGAHVILLARTVGGLEETDDRVKAVGGTATLVPHDLADLDKLDSLGQQIYERFGRLDILVGNAGLLGNISPMSQQKPRDWDRVMTVNVSANQRLIRNCEPLLKLSTAGRAIFVTSRAARRIRGYWGAYATSKAALEAMVKTWAMEIENSRIRANLVDPGALRTRMRATAYPGEEKDLQTPPEAIAELFVDLALPGLTANGEIFVAQTAPQAPAHGHDHHGPDHHGHDHGPGCGCH